jgi:hypothetical protein
MGQISQSISTPRKIILVLLFALTVYAFWPRGHNDMEAAKSWNLNVDNNGRLQFMGITLGETRLAEAEKLLHVKSSRALFVENQKDNGQSNGTAGQLEAFFDNLDHDAKLVLNLTASDTLLSRIRERAYHPMDYPNGNHRVGIAPEDQGLIDELTAGSLTYLLAARYNAQSVHALLGPPAQEITLKSGEQHWLYPNFGLDFISPDKGSSVMQMVPPAAFDKLLAPLMQASRETASNP